MTRLFELLKKVRPYNIKKGFKYLKHYGFKEFMIRFRERIEPEEVPYGPWYEKHAVSLQELEKQKKRKFSGGMKISIAVPVFRTKERFLREMIESVQAQSYANWELCIANASPEDENVRRVLNEYASSDERIRVKELDENKGIGANTNSAFEMASGDYIALLDHDDLLAPDALFEAAVMIEKSGPDIIYTDEDKVTGPDLTHNQPHFKPDFNIDLLRANNYICHLLIVKRGIVEKTGGFREGFDGAQDHDFILRCAEYAENIGHIPRVLYHWRTHEASTADNPNSKLYAYEAGVRAVSESLERQGIKAKVSQTLDFGFYKVEYEPEGNPLVSIIIPNKDGKDTLKACVDSIFEKSTYKNIELLIVENNSETKEIFEYYKELEKDSRVRVIKWEAGFNFSAINNFAVKYAKGDYLIFLNNDIEVITLSWIESMLGNVQRREVGAAGCKLIYPDNTVQHAGIIIGIGGIAGHAFLNMPANRTGYLHRASTQMDVSAVTAACMMMRKEVFEEIGGFEEKLTVAFNDVDLCLRIREKGYLIVYDAYVSMYHFESKTRGAEDTEEKARRFYSEIEFMRSRWEKLLKDGDPCYNPNLTLSKANYSLRPHRG